MRLLQRVIDNWRAAQVSKALLASDVQEFFACGYVDFLSHRHGTFAHSMRDDLGLMDALFEMFEEFGLTSAEPREGSRADRRR